MKEGNRFLNCPTRAFVFGSFSRISRKENVTFANVLLRDMLWITASAQPVFQGGRSKLQRLVGMSQSADSGTQFMEIGLKTKTEYVHPKYGP